VVEVNGVFACEGALRRVADVVGRSTLGRYYTPTSDLKPGICREPRDVIPNAQARLQALLAHHGLSCYQLGRLTGVNRSGLALVAAGKMGMRATSWARIVAQFPEPANAEMVA
jgi:hypothetical protein